MAVALLNGERLPSQTSMDIWALGCCLYQLVAQVGHTARQAVHFRAVLLLCIGHLFLLSLPRPCLLFSLLSARLFLTHEAPSFWHAWIRRGKEISRGRSLNCVRTV